MGMELSLEAYLSLAVHDIIAWWSMAPLYSVHDAGPHDCLVCLCAFQYKQSEWAHIHSEMPPKMGAIQNSSPSPSLQQSQFLMCQQSPVKHVGSSNQIEAQEPKTVSNDAALPSENFEQGGHEDREILASDSDCKDDQKDLPKDQEGH